LIYDRDAYYGTLDGFRFIMFFKRAFARDFSIVMRGTLQITSDGLKIDYRITKSIGGIIFNLLFSLLLIICAFLLNELFYFFIVLAVVCVTFIFRIPNKSVNILEQKLNDILDSAFN